MGNYVISKEQAAAFARLIKEQVAEYCKQHRPEYIAFLESIKDTDKQAKKELERLTQIQKERQI